MSEITQPLSIGITAQPANASIALTSGARMKITLLAPAGMMTSLIRYLPSVGEALQQAEDAHHVRAAAHLHRREDLAVVEMMNATMTSSTTQRTRRSR